MKLLATADIYFSWKLIMLSSANLAQDTFTMMLVGKNYIIDLEHHHVLADVGSEVEGNGYSRQFLRGIALTQEQKGVRMSAENIEFTAQGGSFTAHKYLIYDESVLLPFKPLVSVGYLREDKEEIVVTDGNTLTVSFAPGGILFLE